MLPIAQKSYAFFASLAVLLLCPSLEELRLSSRRDTGLAYHCNVASSDVHHQNGVVYADREDDPSCILVLTEDVGVDHDQEYGNKDEACDVAEHLSFALPG